jgi:hypothetical protein
LIKATLDSTSPPMRPNAPVASAQPVVRLVTTAVMVASLQAGAPQRPVNQVLMVGTREAEESPVRIGMSAGVFRHAAASEFTPTAVIVSWQLSDLQELISRRWHRLAARDTDVLGGNVGYQSRQDKERQHDGRNNKGGREHEIHELLHLYQFPCFGRARLFHCVDPINYPGFSEAPNSFFAVQRPKPP